MHVDAGDPFGLDGVDVRESLVDPFGSPMAGRKPGASSPLYFRRQEPALR